MEVYMDIHRRRLHKEKFCSNSIGIQIMRKCRIACTLNNSKKCTKPPAKRPYQIKAIRVYSLSRSDISADISPMDTHFYGRFRSQIKIYQ